MTRRIILRARPRVAMITVATHTMTEALGDLARPLDITTHIAMAQAATETEDRRPRLSAAIALPRETSHFEWTSPLGLTRTVLVRITKRGEITKDTAVAAVAEAATSKE